MTVNFHPLTETKPNPCDQNDQLINSWGLASIATDAIQVDGIHGPAADMARKLLGDTTELMQLLIKVEAKDPAAVRVFQAQFAFEAEAKLRNELGLD